MKLLERIFHEHRFEQFVTDRYLKKDTVIEEGVYLCSCGKRHPVLGNWTTRGKIFRNRRIPEDAQEIGDIQRK